MKKNYPLLIPLLILFYSCNSTSETAKEYVFVDPSEAGFDTEKLKAVESVIEEEINLNHIAGAVALVARNGNIVMEKAWGWQDKGADKSMETHHLFRIASMTKVITSVAILQLYEQGKLKLDDPLEKFIPEFANPSILINYDEEKGDYLTEPSSRSITIHDLLTHTSGIAYGFTNPKIFGTIYAKAGVPDLGTEDSLTIAETMAALGELPLAHEPGEKFTYGLNTDVLGRVVEVVSGLSLADYFQEFIFDPLGMEDTGFYLPGREADLTILYTIRDSTIIEYPNDPKMPITPDFPITGAMTYHSGGAGLTATARDYFTFLQALLNEGEWQGKRILKSFTFELMTTNQIGDINFGGNHFGYGLQITTEAGQKPGMRPAGSLSWGGAFQTTYWIDVKNDMVVVLMTQVLPSPYQKALYEGFEKALYAALVSSKE